ncbi:hypothetical protein BaOVIS_020640 [Babesia ovis]|uniref:TFIIS N-terminal domain-containing protein n=1 Tax=Babesia ovis TaxID=5869 RepID=A0A9W5WV45_BABOV|nr:hypothetical protein BaOVIS_020640 [Babesia ovis]
MDDSVDNTQEHTSDASDADSPRLDFDDVDKTDADEIFQSNNDDPFDDLIDKTDDNDMAPTGEAASNDAVTSDDGVQAQKSRKLKKQAFVGPDDAAGRQEGEATDSVDGIKIPKKTQRKKGKTKNKQEPDGEFVPPSGAFDKNHLDADYYSDDDFEERKVNKKKQVSAGKLYFDEVLKRVKERRKKTIEMTSEECQHHCRQLVEKMVAAAADDVTAVQQGKPGLAKLKMINEISDFSKPAWRNWCITEGAAVALASWIAPLPDGSLPNLTVRTKVLQIALMLPFQANDLRDNDLGRQIVALWRHPDESDANRVLIRTIVQKWVRPMLGLASNYADMQQDYSMHSKTSVLSMDGEAKERKISQKFVQHKAQMGSIIVNQERINSRLTQLFRGIESKRRAPSKATKVSMDGSIV